MKIYFDACSLSRLTDDQMEPRIREEAEAVERVLTQVRLGLTDLISSEALEDEARRNPSMERRLEVETLLSLAAHTVEVDDSVTQRGVTCFLQNRVHLKAATLRKICHIGHRRQMANMRDKPLVWLKGEVKTPPFTNQARLEAGLLLQAAPERARVESAPFATNARNRSTVPRAANRRS